MNTVAPTPEPTTVDTYLTDLNKAFEILCQRIARLEDRLGPVLLAPLPSSTPSPDLTGRCDLACALQNQVIRFNNLNQSLDSLIDRINL